MYKQQKYIWLFALIGSVFYTSTISKNLTTKNTLLSFILTHTVHSIIYCNVNYWMLGGKFLKKKGKRGNYLFQSWHSGRILLPRSSLTCWGPKPSLMGAQILTHPCADTEPWGTCLVFSSRFHPVLQLAWCAQAPDCCCYRLQTHGEL